MAAASFLSSCWDFLSYTIQSLCNVQSLFPRKTFTETVARSALSSLYKRLGFFTAVFSPSLEMGVVCLGFFCSSLNIEHLPKLQRPEVDTALGCTVKIALSAPVGSAGVIRAL